VLCSFLRRVWAAHVRFAGEQNVTLKTLEQLVGRLKCPISDVFPEK